MIPREPEWLSREDVGFLHQASIEKYGGSPGVRDEGLVVSAITRPVNLSYYRPEADMASLAAAYAFGLAKNHGFIDGNKRIAFLAMGAFLHLNHWRLAASETEAYAAMLDLAAGHSSEEDLAEWLRARIEAVTS